MKQKETFAKDKIMKKTILIILLCLFFTFYVSALRANEPIKALYFNFGTVAQYPSQNVGTTADQVKNASDWGFNTLIVGVGNNNASNYNNAIGVPVNNTYFGEYLTNASIYGMDVYAYFPIHPYYQYYNATPNGTLYFAQNNTGIDQTYPSLYDINYTNWSIKAIGDAIKTFNSSPSLKGVFLDIEVPWASQNQIIGRVDYSYPAVQEFNRRYGSNYTNGTKYLPFTLANETSTNSTKFNETLIIELETLNYEILGKYLSDIKKECKIYIPNCKLGVVGFDDSQNDQGVSFTLINRDVDYWNIEEAKNDTAFYTSMTLPSMKDFNSNTTYFPVLYSYAGTSTPQSLDWWQKSLGMVMARNQDYSIFAYEDLDRNSNNAQQYISLFNQQYNLKFNYYYNISLLYIVGNMDSSGGTEKGEFDTLIDLFLGSKNIKILREKSLWSSLNGSYYGLNISTEKVAYFGSVLATQRISNETFLKLLNFSLNGGNLLVSGGRSSNSLGIFDLAGDNVGWRMPLSRDLFGCTGIQWNSNAAGVNLTILQNNNFLMDSLSNNITAPIQPRTFTNRFFSCNSLSIVNSTFLINDSQRIGILTHTNLTNVDGITTGVNTGNVTMIGSSVEAGGMILFGDYRILIQRMFSRFQGIELVDPTYTIEPLNYSVRKAIYPLNGSYKIAIHIDPHNHPNIGESYGYNITINITKANILSTSQAYDPLERIFVNIIKSGFDNITLSFNLNETQWAKSYYILDKVKVTEGINGMTDSNGTIIDNAVNFSIATPTQKKIVSAIATPFNSTVVFTTNGCGLIEFINYRSHTGLQTIQILPTDPIYSCSSGTVTLQNITIEQGYSSNQFDISYQGLEVCEDTLFGMKEGATLFPSIIMTVVMLLILVILFSAYVWKKDLNVIQDITPTQVTTGAVVGIIVTLLIFFFIYVALGKAVSVMC